MATRDNISHGDMIRIAKLVEKLVNDRQLSVTNAVVSDVLLNYNLCTTTTPDSSHKVWYGPVAIGIDCVVTIGASALVEIEDGVLSIEQS